MTYEIKWQTKPGMCAQYSGVVTVNANNSEEAIQRCWRIIKGSFFDRSFGSFKFTIVSVSNS